MEYDDFVGRKRGVNLWGSLGGLVIMAGVGVASLPVFITGGSVDSVWYYMIGGLVIILFGGLLMLSGYSSRNRLQWDLEKNSRVYQYQGDSRFNRNNARRTNHNRYNNDDDEDDEEVYDPVKTYNQRREELLGAFGFAKPNLHL